MALVQTLVVATWTTIAGATQVVDAISILSFIDNPVTGNLSAYRVMSDDLGTTYVTQAILSPLVTVTPTPQYARDIRLTYYRP